MDQGIAAWGCNGNSISGAQATAVGTGAANTAAIVAGCGEANTAAKVADAYVLNGYTDWYLPSRDELDLLYAQKGVVGVYDTTYYWSSSEVYSDGAWFQDFGTGGQGYSIKLQPHPVRAVRAF